MTSTDASRDAVAQQQIWNELVGDAWVTYASIHDQQAAPFGHAVLDALGDLAGTRVLDVGCGTGATTTQLVGRGAVDVLGIDLSAAMVETASAVAAEHIRVEVGDVVALEPLTPFDVIFSRFGVMFFDDPVAAFTHLRTIGAPAARLGFCCWGPPIDNPVMTLPVMASVPVLGPPDLAGPGSPGPFSLSTAQTIHNVLKPAGWTQITVDELVLEPPHPAGDAEAVANMALEFNPLLVQGLRRHPTRRAQARDAIADALRTHERGGVVHLRSTALIVTAKARKPTDEARGLTASMA